jgi:hypothetical protein
VLFNPTLKIATFAAGIHLKKECDFLVRESSSTMGVVVLPGASHELRAIKGAILLSGCSGTTTSQLQFSLLLSTAIF